MFGVDIGTSLLGHGQGIRGLRSLDYGLRRGGAGPASGGCHSLLGSFLRRFSGLPGGLFGRRSQFFRRYFCQLADLFGGFLGLLEGFPGLLKLGLGLVRLFTSDLDLLFCFIDPSGQDAQVW